MIRKSLAKLIWKYFDATPAHPGRGLLLRAADWLDPNGRPREVAPDVRFLLRLSNPVDMEYWKRTYEAEDDARAFLNLLGPGMTVVDVGANYGLYTLQAARAVGPTGRVLAFEPAPHVYARLADHVRLNGAANVTTHPVAVSDREGTATFHLGRNDSVGSLLRPTAGRAVEVPTTTLDAFLAAHGVGRVDAVKVDAEGAELLVLRGMRGLLARPHKPILFCEYNFPALAAAGTSAAELFDFTLAHGYAAHLIENGRLRPVAELAAPDRRHTEPTSNYLFLPDVGDGPAPGN